MCYNQCNLLIKIDFVCNALIYYKMYFKGHENTFPKLKY